MDSTFLVIVLFEISVDMKLWREQTTNKAHLHRRFQQGIFAKRHNFRVKKGLQIHMKILLRIFPAPCTYPLHHTTIP